MSFEQKCREVYRIAEELFQHLQGEPDWVVFFREIFGTDGAAKKLFDFEELSRFKTTEYYGKIQQMLVQLRKKVLPQNNSREPTQMITVRLPKSLHDALRTEAYQRKTSLNKLCIAKLLQVIDDDLVPE